MAACGPLGMVVASVVAARKRQSGGSLRKTKTNQNLADVPINYLPGQGDVRDFYGKLTVQWAVAALIVMNFFVSATKAQCCLEGEGKTVFFVLEVIFNVAFTIELLVNMYGYFWLPFWKNAWNIFDFVIVCISDVSMFLSDVPGISSLRLLRAFRVVRLFKRVPALKLIIEGVLASLPGVLSAFAVLFLITSIWAIMATDFFRVSRPEQFGNFFYSMLTFFQVMTYDSWYSGVAGSLIRENGVWVAGFFILYVFANSIIMMNVVTAILLERFIAAVNAAQEEAEKAQEEKESAAKAWGSGAQHEDAGVDDELSEHSLEIVNENYDEESDRSVEEVTWKSHGMPPNLKKIHNFKDAQARETAIHNMKREFGSVLIDLERHMMLAVTQLKSLNLTDAASPKDIDKAEQVKSESGPQPVSANGKSRMQMPDSVPGNVEHRFGPQVRLAPDPSKELAAVQTVQIAVRPRESSLEASRDNNLPCPPPMLPTPEPPSAEDSSPQIRRRPNYPSEDSPPLPNTICEAKTDCVSYIPHDSRLTTCSSSPEKQTSRSRSECLACGGFGCSLCKSKSNTSTCASPL